MFSFNVQAMTFFGFLQVKSILKVKATCFLVYCGSELGDVGLLLSIVLNSWDLLKKPEDGLDENLPLLDETAAAMRLQPCTSTWTA